MGYLDYTGLSHFKDKLETIFAPITHSHDAATSSSVGLVQPDNSTITVNNAGVISSIPKISVQDSAPSSDTLVWIDTDAQGADFCFVGNSAPPNDGSVAIWVDTSEDEIPNAQGAAGVSYDNTDSNLEASNVQDAIDGLTIYSEDEIVVGTWINGKPIYRKVINFGALPNATTASINHNIANIETIIRVTGIGVSGNTTIPLPHVAASSTNSWVSFWATGTVIRVVTDSDRSAYTGYAILEYTKTTD